MRAARCDDTPVGIGFVRRSRSRELQRFSGIGVTSSCDSLLLGSSLCRAVLRGPIPGSGESRRRFPGSGDVQRTIPGGCCSRRVVSSRDSPSGQADLR
jgi:hypothetical protein